MTLVACLNVCQKKLECKTISFNKISKTCETFSDSLLDGDISDNLGGILTETIYMTAD